MGVDQKIVDDIYTRLLQSLSPGADSKTRDECVIRLLEMVKTKAINDGEVYARYLVDLFTTFEGTVGVSPVSEVAVEKVLSYLQDCKAFDYPCYFHMLIDLQAIKCYRFNVQHLCLR